MWIFWLDSFLNTVYIPSATVKVSHHTTPFNIFHHDFSFVLMQQKKKKIFFTPSCSVHLHKHCKPHKSLQTAVTWEGNLKWGWTLPSRFTSATEKERHNVGPRAFIAHNFTYPSNDITSPHSFSTCFFFTLLFSFRLNQPVEVAHRGPAILPLPGAAGFVSEGPVLSPHFGVNPVRLSPLLH